MDTENISIDKKYKQQFKNADSFIYYSGGHPLETLLNREYGDCCFIIRRPTYSPNGENVVVLLRNSETLEEYIDKFFNSHRGYSFKSKYVIAFGSVKLLMMAEDENDKFGKYRDLIADAFRDGNIFEKFSDESLNVIHGFEFNGKFRLEDFLLKRLKK